MLAVARGRQPFAEAHRDCSRLQGSPARLRRGAPRGTPRTRPQRPSGSARAMAATARRVTRLRRALLQWASRWRCGPLRAQGLPAVVRWQPAVAGMARAATRLRLRLGLAPPGRLQRSGRRPRLLLLCARYLSLRALTGRTGRRSPARQPQGRSLHDSPPHLRDVLGCTRRSRPCPATWALRSVGRRSRARCFPPRERGRLRPNATMRLCGALCWGFWGRAWL